jgi:voltage-gated potassium channel
LWGAFALAVIVAVGIFGYMGVEGWDFIDSLYMTIITITTVGFAEVHPLTDGGRIFSIFLIVGGVGAAVFAATGMAQYVIEGSIGSAWGRQTMKTRIAQLNRHFILCGFGRVGEEIARTFKAEGMPFVIIDNRPECVARLEETEYLYLDGDATKDEVLKQAGVERARGLVAAVGTDTDNTYITLSARGLCPDLLIEARASSEEALVKLKRAGASRAVLPEAIAGHRMAMLALHPQVVDFIDTVAYGRGREMQLENVDVGANSRLVGVTISTARNETGISTLAMRKRGGDLIANPADEETIESGDQLIVIGTGRRLAALEDVL